MLIQGAKLSILALLVISFLFLFIIMSGHFQDRERPDFEQQSLSQADIGMQELVFLQTRSGQVEWKIQAETAELYEGENRVTIRNARIFLNSSEGLNIRFRGDEGIFDTKSLNFMIQNYDSDIKVELSNGYSILTRTLKWESRDHKIRAEGPVKVLAVDFSVGGIGLLINLDDQNFSVLKDVNVQFH